MNWIWIAVLVVLVIIASIKFKEMGHKAKFFLLALFVIVFLATAGYVYLTTKPDLTSYSGLKIFSQSYFSWLASLGGNMKGITGYAVQQNWGINKTSP